MRPLRDHVRHDAIDADHREQQREAAEDQHDGADVLQSDRPLLEGLAHRLQFEDRLRRIDRPYGRARLGGERRRIAGRPDDERHAASRRLPKRPVDRRMVAAVEPAVNVIARDADDRQPRARAELDPLADRIRVRPIPASEGLGDDRDRLRILAVPVGEPTARSDRNLQAPRRAPAWRSDSPPRAGCSDRDSGRPSISIERPELSPDAGMMLIAAAASTPDTVRRRSTTRRRQTASARRRSDSAPPAATSCIVSTPSGLNPCGPFRNRCTVRTLRAAATRSGSANAISATTSPRRSRRRAAPVVELRPPSLSVSASRGRDAWIAGIRPKTSAVTIASAEVKRDQPEVDVHLIPTGDEPRDLRRHVRRR